MLAALLILSGNSSRSPSGSLSRPRAWGQCWLLSSFCPHERPWLSQCSGQVPTTCLGRPTAVATSRLGTCCPSFPLLRGAPALALSPSPAGQAPAPSLPVRLPQPVGAEGQHWRLLRQQPGGQRCPGHVWRQLCPWAVLWEGTPCLDVLSPLSPTRPCLQHWPSSWPC